MPEATEEHPLYEKVKQPTPQGTVLWMVTVNEGWDNIVVASGMYEHVADWMICILQGRPFAEPRL